MTVIRTTALAVMVHLTASVLTAYSQTIVQGGGPLPPRDARPATPTATGTAAIRGRVFAADSRRPLRRARLQINGPGLPGNGHTISSDSERRVEFRELVGGRYKL